MTEPIDTVELDVTSLLAAQEAIYSALATLPTLQKPEVIAACIAIAVVQYQPDLDMDRMPDLVHQISDYILYLLGDQPHETN
jgi:hypothetical protein